MHSLSIYELECSALDLVLRLAVCEEDLCELGVPAAELGWVPYGVYGRGWLHRACHERLPEGRALGDLLDLRWADAVAFARGADARTLRGVAAQAARGGPRPGVLWAYLTDPRPDARRLGETLGAIWTVRASDDYVERAVAASEG